MVKTQHFLLFNGLRCRVKTNNLIIEIYPMYHKLFDCSPDYQLYTKINFYFIILYYNMSNLYQSEI
jgi:hypothetical protein